MIRYLLSFVLGVWLFQLQPRLPDASLFPLYAGILLGAFALYWSRLPACLVFGFAWAHGYALLNRPADLPAIDLARPLWLEGRVDSLVDSDRLRSRFELRVNRIVQDGRDYQGDWRFRVAWYRDPPSLGAGEWWRFRGKLRPVWGYHNAGGFDYERWLYGQQIRYSASVISDPANQRLSTANTFSLGHIRQQLSNGMASLDDGGPGSALLRALVVGDRAGFSQTDWDVFTRTGTNHLMAISGLHVGLVAGMVGGLVASVWRRTPRLCRRWQAMTAAAISGALAAVVYAGLAGFSIPTQRALLMVLLAMSALLVGRAVRPWGMLALALAAVVAWSPIAVLEAGLWLSFAAVAVILLAITAAPRRNRVWHQWSRLQLAVGVGLMPLLLLFFQKASVVAPVVNLLVIPWFSLVLVPLAMLASLVWWLVPAYGAVLWQAWLWLAEPTLELLRVVASWPWAGLNWPAPTGVVVGLALLAVVLWLAPRGLPARGLAAVLLMPLLFNRPPRPAPGAFEMHLLDVGQGLAVVVQTAGHVLVYDAGPRYRSGFNTGDAVVLPFLRRAGVSTVDTLVVSHADSDHSGGAEALLRGLKVRKILAGEPAVVAGGQACHAGQAWSWDGVSFEVLSPAVAQAAEGNNSSCVVRVAGSGGSLLIPGDIEAEVERTLLTNPRFQPTDVVIAPHHGSLSSSLPEFVARLRPRHVLYATGHGNRWGFPRQEVALRWSAQGATSWDTARDGAISISFSGSLVPLRPRGHRRHHYWQP